MKQGFDPYVTLQVIREADPDVIQAAFRTLARKRHPDVGGSEEAMAALNEAWSILRDRRRRTRYDRDCAATAAVSAARTTPKPAQAAWQAPVPGAAAPGPSTGSGPTPMGPGTLLDFGRYEGHSLAELAARDPDYLEWLVRTRIGSRFRHEVDRLLVPTREATATGRPIRRGFFRRA
jgi:curved DNA-binding protein CbpA